MPTYEVLEKGTHEGVFYSPSGKRDQLHTDKPFKKTPSWLKPMKAESASANKRRVATRKADAEKAKSDRADIDNASFLGEAGESSKTETL